MHLTKRHDLAAACLLRAANMSLSRHADLKSGLELVDKEIEADNKEHQPKDEGHASISGCDLHFFIGFFASDGFVTEEDHVSTIEHRDGQEVDHREIRTQKAQKNQQ